MRLRRFLAAALAAAAATTSPALADPAPADPAPADPAAASPAFAPLNEADCYALRDRIETSFQLSPAFLVTADAPVDYRVFGVSRACRIAFNGSGVLFETNERLGFAPAETAMRAAMEAAGWSAEGAPTEIAADGPYATLYAMEKAGALCIVEVALSLPEDARRGGPLSRADLLRLSVADRRYRLSAACAEPAAHGRPESAAPGRVRP